MELTTRTGTIFTDGTGLPDGAVHEVAASAHAALNRMATSADEAAQSVRPAIDRVAQMGHHTVDSVADVAGSTAGWVNKQSLAVKSTGQNAVAETRKYVAVHPLQSIGVAVAAGLLLGRWMR
jgi:ElaB/YqjD/DUF883 family membrane-anchored ribosome-binding protein